MYRSGEKQGNYVCQRYNRAIEAFNKQESGSEMEWWSSLPVFWQGFICGGIVVPLVIVVIEIIVKLGLRRA